MRQPDLSGLADDLGAGDAGGLQVRVRRAGGAGRASPPELSTCSSEVQRGALSDVGGAHDWEAQRAPASSDVGGSACGRCRAALQGARKGEREPPSPGAARRRLARRPRPPPPPALLGPRAAGPGGDSGRGGWRWVRCRVCSSLRCALQQLAEGTAHHGLPHKPGCQQLRNRPIGRLYQLVPAPAPAGAPPPL